MLRLTTLFCAIFATFVLALNVSAQPIRPSPSDGEPTQTQDQPKSAQQAPAQDQRGTEQAPIVVKVIPTPKSEPEAATDTKERNEKMELDRKLVDFNGDLAYYTKVLAWIAGLQFLALLGQIVFLAFAFGESRRATSIAREALNRIERAFAFHKGYLQPTPLVDLNGALRGWRVIPVLENSGSTPTKHMTFHMSIQVREDDLPDDFDFPDLWNEGAERDNIPLFIGPKSQVWGPPADFHIVDLDGVLHRRKMIFVWGWIDYDDVFDGTPRHRTEFCHQVAVAGDPRNPAHITLRTYRHYNGADDECHRRPLPYNGTRTDR